jgi:hypothetical protein
MHKAIKAYWWRKSLIYRLEKKAMKRELEITSWFLPFYGLNKDYMIILEFFKMNSAFFSFAIQTKHSPSRRFRWTRMHDGEIASI